MKKNGNIFSGIFVGIILIIVSAILLIYNEGNNVKNIKTVAEARNNLVTLNDPLINSINEGALVSVKGEVTYDEDYLTDDTFGVNSDSRSYKMVRYVEMYQWDEDSNNNDDKTTYTYTKKWSESLINSGSFHESGHSNPSSMPYTNMHYYANNIRLGDYLLTDDNLKKVATDEKVYISSALSLPTNYSIQDNYITSSLDINNPEIGDVRIYYKIVSTDDISIVAKQVGQHLVDYVSSQGKTVHLVSAGILSGEEQINRLEASNNTLKWILRIAGILLMCVGFAGIISPLTKVLSFIPYVGNSVSSFISLMAMMVGLLVSFVIIGISWIVYRPLLGCALLGFAAILGFMIFSLIRKNKGDKQTELIQNKNNQLGTMQEKQEPINQVNNSFQINQVENASISQVVSQENQNNIQSPTETINNNQDLGTVNMSNLLAPEPTSQPQENTSENPSSQNINIQNTQNLENINNNNNLE